MPPSLLARNPAFRVFFKRSKLEIADFGFVLRTPTLRAGSQFRIADFCSFNLQQSEISTLKSKITTTFRCWSARRGQLVLGGRVCIRVWCQFPGRHCSEMVSTLDRNDNQDTGVFWALDRDKGRKRVLGVGVIA